MNSGSKETLMNFKSVAGAQQNCRPFGPSMGNLAFAFAALSFFANGEN